MRGHFTRIALAVLLALASFGLIHPVYALTYYQVNVLVAYDEEFDHTAYWGYGYSAETLARVFLLGASSRFYSAFKIKFSAVAFTSWDSEDNPSSYEEMFWEVVNETGFISGMKWDSSTVHVMVAFTDQSIPDNYGLSHMGIGVVLVREFYTYAAGQHTDNILQHELSHLYGAPEHYMKDLDCVMNNYRVRIGLPEYMLVPYALLTENWCEGCRNLIIENRALWGYIDCGGGGGGGDILFTPDNVEVEIE